MSTPSTATKPGGFLDRYFKISQRGSTIGREVRGGLVTFFAMCYIIVLNPIILGGTDGTGSVLGGNPDNNHVKIAAVTALIAGVMTIVMGVVANFPLALAAGLGLNAVVAFSIAAMPDVTWADAMGLVVLEGIIILLLVLTGFREAVFRAVPKELRTAISVGIGLFIAFIGLVDAGVVRVPAGASTPVELGVTGSLAGWPALVFVLGLLTAIILYIKKVRGALLIAILGATVFAVIVEAIANIGPKFADDGSVNPHGWALTLPKIPDTLVDTPNFSLLGHFSLFGSFSKIGIVAGVLLVFSLLLADFFDTMGTMVAVGAEGDLLDKQGNPLGTRKILVVDSVAAIAGGAGSASSNTSYIESATGVGEGARTGLASVVTGIAFLLATFLAPVVSMIPSEAATPALVVVGFLMMTQVADISWKSAEVAIPAFLTIILMPFTYSITAGMGAGFIAFVVIQIATGKLKKVHPLMWITAAMFILYFVRGPLQDIFG